MIDKEKKLYETIEVLNMEVINLKKSKEYLIGSSIIKSIELLKKRNLKKIIERYIHKKKYRYIESHLTSYNQKNDYDFKYNDDKLLKNKKIAIYTCIVGDYDRLKEPFFTQDNVDYYLFTDKKYIESNNWIIKEIPNSLKHMYNNTLINRYIKFHPNEFLKGYDYCIYIDGNVNIFSNIEPMIEKVNCKLGIAMHKHSTRDCIYLESKTCQILRKGNIENLEKQVQQYYKEGMPKNYGLLEATMIISDLNNYNSIDILNKWWDEFYNSRSLRDQIALPYILWRNGYKIDDIGILGNNIYTNPKVRVDTH